MSDQFPPVDWVPEKPSLTSEDARRLAHAIESVGNAVGTLAQRVSGIEGGQKQSPLAEMDYIGVLCRACNRQLFSNTSLDPTRLDWTEIGRSLFEHAAEHVAAGGYIYSDVQFTMLRKYVR